MQVNFVISLFFMFMIIAMKRRPITDGHRKWELVCFVKQIVSPIAILQTWGEWQLVFILKIAIFTLWGATIAGDAGEYVIFMLLYASFKLTNIIYDVTVVKEGASRFSFDQAMSSSLLLCFGAFTGYLIVSRCQRQMRLSFLIDHLSASATVMSVDSSKKDHNSLPHDSSPTVSPIIHRKGRLQDAGDNLVSPLASSAVSKRKSRTRGLEHTMQKASHGNLSPHGLSRLQTRGEGAQSHEEMRT